MAEEENRENKEASAAENDEPQDVGEKIAADEDKKEEEEKGQERAKRFGFGQLALAALSHKWILLSAVGLVLLFVGLAITTRQKWMNVKAKGVPVISNEKIKQDNLYEEVLAPFFIPLPPDSSKQVAAIDCSVIWDGVASVRFRGMELQIRNHLYQYIVNLAETDTDFQEKAPFLEIEMGRILREWLGTQDLVVKIKEIKTF